MDNKKKVLKARLHIMDNLPQFAPLALCLPWRLVDCPTAYLSKSGVVGLGNSFVKDLTVPQVAFVILHEGFHHLLNYFNRLGDRVPKVWNIAQDAVINEMLRRMPGIEPIRGGVFPESLGLTWGDGESQIPTADEVYDYLLRNATKMPSNAACGTGEGEDLAPGPGEAAIDPKEMQNAISRLASAARAIGAGSSELDMWADAAIGKAKYDPLVDLRNRVVRAVETLRGRLSEPNWNKINRRYDWLAGRRYFSPSLDVVVDTSGSMGQDGDIVLTEIANLILKVGKVYCLTVDTAVNHEGYVKSAKEFLRVAKGGGGTELSPAFDRLREARRKNPIVCITDGELNDPGAPKDTIWLVTSKEGVKEWMKRPIVVS